MTDKTVKVGRREVLLNDFIEAVSGANSPRGVCMKLGFNEKVSSTVNAVKLIISDLQLDTTHFKKAYSITDKVKNRPQKQFILNSENKQYYSAYQRSINPASWSTYKATIGNFMESIKDKDFAHVTVDEIHGYAEGSENKISHLKSLMTYIVKNNINYAAEKVSRDILIWMINETQARNIVNDHIFPDEISLGDKELVEGLSIKITVNAHERNKAARRKCLEHYGFDCSVCGKSLDEIYGDRFTGLIHVHHIVPISNYDNEHDIDPIKDLRPICPNCHMIIHSRAGNPYTIEEAKVFLRST